MGLLESLNQHARETLGTLAGNERINQRVTGYEDAFVKGLLQALPMLSKQPQSITPEDAINSGLLGAIKVFHGSPHKFDAFDMSKIGTGEGAQAYGHGLYFAENPKVAKDYADTLSKTAKAQWQNGLKANGEKIDMNEAGGYLYEAAKNGYDSAYNKLITLIQKTENAKPPKWAYAKGKEKNLEGFINQYKAELNNYTQWLERLNDFKGAELDIARPNMYETSLEWPDPAREAADPMGPQHFLDWDKPLSEQPESIQSILHNVAKQKKQEAADFGEMPPDISGTGSNIWTELSNYLSGGRRTVDSPEIARKYLKDQGIPGIRYLDGGSRGAGEGSSNYVVFDDKIPRIVERNGKKIK